MGQGALISALVHQNRKNNSLNRLKVEAQIGTKFQAVDVDTTLQIRPFSVTETKHTASMPDSIHKLASALTRFLGLRRRTSKENDGDSTNAVRSVEAAEVDHAP